MTDTATALVLAAKAVAVTTAAHDKQGVALAAAKAVCLKACAKVTAATAAAETPEALAAAIKAEAACHAAHADAVAKAYADFDSTDAARFAATEAYQDAFQAHRTALAGQD